MLEVDQSYWSIFHDNTTTADLFKNTVNHLLSEDYRFSCGRKDEKFRSAILPFSYFLERSRVDQRSICYMELNTNLNHDAVIQNQSGSRYIQIGRAIDENEHLRIEQMKKDGHVDALSPVQKIPNSKKERQTKGKFSISITPIVNERSVVHTVRFNEILSIVDKKAAKNYPKNVELLFAFDDWTGFDDSVGLLNDFFSNEILPRFNEGRIVHLLGYKSIFVTSASIKP